jgi:hypothetical protein
MNIRDLLQPLVAVTTKAIRSKVQVWTISILDDEIVLVQ